MPSLKTYVSGAGCRLLIPLVLGLLLPLAADAQNFVSCSGLSCTLADLMNIPARIYNWATGFAISLLLLLIVIAGVRMLLFYFSDAPEKELTAAKDMLRHAIFGFVIVMLSWLIVTTLLTLFLGVSPGSPFFQNIFGSSFSQQRGSPQVPGSGNSAAN